MTDKEFRKLSRSELIEVIYKLQKIQDDLRAENAEIRKQLLSKEIKISEAGSIAEAALELNNIFASAQKAADEYLSQVKLSNSELEAKTSGIIDDAKKQAADILAAANRRSAEIIESAETDAKAKWDAVNHDIDILLQSNRGLMTT